MFVWLCHVFFFCLSRWQFRPRGLRSAYTLPSVLLLCQHTRIVALTFDQAGSRHANTQPKSHICTCTAEDKSNDTCTHTLTGTRHIFICSFTQRPLPRSSNIHTHTHTLTDQQRIMYTMNTQAVNLQFCEWWTSVGFYENRRTTSSPYILSGAPRLQYTGHTLKPGSASKYQLDTSRRHTALTLRLHHVMHTIFFFINQKLEWWKRDWVIIDQF